MRAPGCGRYKAPGYDKTQETYESIKDPRSLGKEATGGSLYQENHRMCRRFSRCRSRCFCGRIPARRQKETDEKSMGGRTGGKNARRLFRASRRSAGCAGLICPFGRLHFARVSVRREQRNETAEAGMIAFLYSRFGAPVRALAFCPVFRLFSASRRSGE